MADTPTVMPQLHMPLQSGSDAILKAMRRSYRSTKFLGILERVRAQIPLDAISTDIIVGFPGETEEDFQDTLNVVEQARFASAFTFQYSIREGTPAASMPDQVSKAVVQERYERLVALQDRISWEENQKLVGTELRVMVSAEGTKDAETHRLSGRAEDSRLVHFEVPAGSEQPRPGDVVTLSVSDAKPFYLIADSADGAPLQIRRTMAGDAWDRAQAASCAVPATNAPLSTPGRVSLGLPSIRVSPAPIYDSAAGERSHHTRSGRRCRRRRHRTVRAVFRPRRAARCRRSGCRDCERRRQAALPWHGHRNSQAFSRRATWHSSPPPRHP